MKWKEKYDKTTGLERKAAGILLPFSSSPPPTPLSYTPLVPFSFYS